ncbi:MAG: aminotransferase class I/II-fold pyridoxal phosphate-dependent enzyme [Thermoplasmatales archaeon]|nr:aminotransferase class I/II-fold pyridoxal phosphate-dependent enzyme [Thermoplasmatales archaeon]
MRISRRLDSIPMSGIRKMFDLAGPDSVNLGLGEPDLEPPAAAIEGMRKAVLDGHNKYGPTAGIMPLREAVAKRYSAYGDVSAGKVMITPSGSSALLEISQAFIDPGDEVLVPSPGFVIYSPHAVLAGGKPVEYGFKGKDFQPDVDGMQSLVTKKTKAVYVNNPSNPTGSVLSEKSWKAICDLADDNDLIIVSDEVYDGFVYEGRHQSFIPRLDRAIVVGGFSKMMAVTGWRLGFAIAGEDFIDPLIKMQYHVCASPPMPQMYGVLAAMPGIDAYLEKARAVFRKRRDLIVDRINAIDGMSVDSPKGAFYAFPSYSADIQSVDLANELARNGLICTPGSAFGSRGEGHLRFSYAAGEESIGRGMDILSSTMEGLGKP